MTKFVPRRGFLVAEKIKVWYYWTQYLKKEVIEMAELSTVFEKAVKGIDGLRSVFEINHIKCAFAEDCIVLRFPANYDPNGWYVGNFKERFLPSLGRALAELGVTQSVRVERGEHAHVDASGTPFQTSLFGEVTRDSAQKGGQERASKPRGLVSEFTFENFVVGDTNRVAHDAILDLASWPDNPRELSPLLVTGGTSSGKTHLLNAATWLALEKRHNARVVYVAANDFYHHFVDSQLSDERVKKIRFRERYHNADFLIVDDLHVLAGKDKTETEFRNIYDSIMNRGGLLLMSSVPTSEALQFRAEVSSRASGMSVEIRQPEFNLRVAIVTKKAELYGVPLSGDDFPTMIAERLGPDIRKLEGGIKLLKRYVDRYGRIISEGLLNELFGVKGVAREGLTIAEIQRAAADHLQISDKVFSLRSRSTEDVYARDLALYFCIKLLGRDPKVLERAFNRDRTWVDTAFHRAQQRIADDPHHFGKDVEVLTEILSKS